MTKIKRKPPSRILTDDYSIVVGGETYYPHAGEWIEARSTQKVGDLKAYKQYAALMIEIQMIEGDEDADMKTFDLLTEHFDEFTGLLASRIRDWNWTDDDDQPLPKPDGTSAPFEQISFEELLYLMGKLRGGETAEQRGKDSGAMPTGGSDSQPTPIQRPSGMARSRMKAT